MTATGYLAPPALSGPKLFNFAALASWERVYRERLHEGEPVFRDGWQWSSVARFGEEREWDENPFRCLHAAFLRRSSRDPAAGEHVRLNIAEADTYRGDFLVFIDGDTVPRRHFVRALRQAAVPGWFVAGKRLLLGRELSERVLADRLPIQRWSLPHWALHGGQSAPLRALTARDRRRPG